MWRWEEHGKCRALLERTSPHFCFPSSVQQLQQRLWSGHSLLHCQASPTTGSQQQPSALGWRPWHPPVLPNLPKFDPPGLTWRGFCLQKPSKGYVGRIRVAFQVSGDNICKTVGQRSASGRLSSLRQNFLASSVCLWSPDQISKHVRGVRAIVAASSMLPQLTLVLQHQVNLLDPVRHWAVWLPTLHQETTAASMSKDFCRMWWLRFSTGRSSGVPIASNQSSISCCTSCSNCRATRCSAIACAATFFGDHHELQTPNIDKETSQKNCCRAGFACSEDPSNGQTSPPFLEGKHYDAESS